MLNSFLVSMVKQALHVVSQPEGSIWSSLHIRPGSHEAGREQGLEFFPLTTFVHNNHFLFAGFWLTHLTALFWSAHCLSQLSDQEFKAVKTVKGLWHSLSHTHSLTLLHPHANLSWLMLQYTHTDPKWNANKNEFPKETRVCHPCFQN